MHARVCTCVCDEVRSQEEVPSEAEDRGADWELSPEGEAGFPGRGNSWRISETQEGHASGLSARSVLFRSSGPSLPLASSSGTNVGPRSGRRGPGPSCAVGSSRTRVPLGPGSHPGPRRLQLLMGLHAGGHGKAGSVCGLPVCGPPSLVCTHEVVICGVNSDTQKPVLVHFLEKWPCTATGSGGLVRGQQRERRAPGPGSLLGFLRERQGKMGDSVGTASLHNAWAQGHKACLQLSGTWRPRMGWWPSGPSIS